MIDEFESSSYKFKEISLPPLRQRDFTKIFNVLGVEACEQFIKFLMFVLHGHPRLLRICVSEISLYRSKAILPTTTQLSTEGENTSMVVEQLQKEPSERSEADKSALGPIFSPEGFLEFFKYRLDRQPLIWWKLLSVVSASALRIEYPEVRSKLLGARGIYKIIITHSSFLL